MIAEERPPLAGSRRTASAFALSCAFMPMLTPVAEVHHLILIAPAAILVTIAAAARTSAPIRVGAAFFWLLFLAARLDRGAPLYMLAVAVLAALGVAVGRGSTGDESAGPAPGRGGG